MSTDHLPATVEAPSAPSPIGNLVTDGRMPELGEIRFGEQVAATKRDGTPTTRPATLECPRLTSTDESLLVRAGAVLGGEPQPWTNPATGEAAYELYTTSPSIAVQLPLGAGVPIIDQVYEQYRGGYRSAWSDGHTRIHEFNSDNQWVDRPVDPVELQGDDWTRVTRLFLELADVPGLGFWGLRTTSAYAAEDLPGIVKYLAYMQLQRPVAARLTLKRKTQQSMKAGKGPEKRVFGYPILIIDDVTPRQLLEQRRAEVAQLEESAAQTDPRAILNAPTVTAEPVTIWAGAAVGEVTDPGPGDPPDGKARRQLWVDLSKAFERDYPVPTQGEVKDALAAEGLSGASAASFADLEHGEQNFRSAVIAVGKAVDAAIEAGAADEPPAEDVEGETIEPTEESQTIPGTEAPAAYSEPE